MISYFITNNFFEHVVQTTFVLEVLRLHYAKISNGKFGMTKINYMEHIIYSSGVKADP